MSKLIFTNIDLTQEERDEIIVGLGMRMVWSRSFGFSKRVRAKVSKVHDSLLKKLEVPAGAKEIKL
jgi:hypothetical protein